jgi:YgiT-type zinc finger domain-containing protein
MECLYCKGTSVKARTSYTASRKGDPLILDAVPAWVCGQCGEPLFEEETVDAIQDGLREVEARLETAPLIVLKHDASLGGTVMVAGSAPADERRVAHLPGWWQWIGANVAGLLLGTLVAACIIPAIMLALSYITSWPEAWKPDLYTVFTALYFWSVAAMLAMITGVGLAIAGGAPVMVTVLALSQESGGTTESVLLASLSLALAGLGLGLGQWRILRSHLSVSSHWVFASCLAWAAGGVLLGVLDLPWAYVATTSDLLIPAALTGLAAGSIGGLFQFLLLRPRFRRAWFWPVASSVAWTMGVTVAAVVPTLAGLSAGAAVASITTGWALRLMTNPDSEEMQREGTL